MRLAFHIALRYLFSKKSTNAINIISGISGLGIFISSAALIIILSVFNGFEGLVLNSYDTFSPDVKISPEKGKVMAMDPKLHKKLEQIPGVDVVIDALEEKVLLSYNDQQCIASVKGMSENFIEHNRGLDSAMIAGELILQEDSMNYAVLGAGIRYALSVDVQSGFSPLLLYSPKKEFGNSIDPSTEFNQSKVIPIGAFSLRQETDDQYVLVPLRLARSLFEEQTKVSSIEISITEQASLAEVKGLVEQELQGKGWKIRDKYEQNEVLYKVLNSERWAVYLILTFITVIAICNIMGSLTMLLIDKKKDIAILQSMGAGPDLIRSVYWLEGLLIACIGSFLGLIAGALFCFLQQKFGFITAGNADGVLINAYPVLMKPIDFLLVIGTVLGISALATWLAVQFGLRRMQLMDGLMNP